MTRIVTEDDGPVRTVTIDRPEAHNCIDGPTAAALADAVDAFAADASARVLVLTGAGERSFCAGADLKNTESLWNHAASERGSPLGFARLDPGKPTIGAINGYAFAGGLELALWCDFRIAAANAEFGVLNRRWGIPLIDGGTQRLPRIVGQGNALWLIETGMRIDAERAKQIGLVQEVVPQGRALKRSMELAHVIASSPRAAALADRASALATWGMDLDAGLLAERARGVPTVADPEMPEALARFTTAERPESPRPAG